MRSCIPILVVGALLTPFSWATARAITILDDGVAVIDSPVDEVVAESEHPGQTILPP